MDFYDTPLNEWQVKCGQLSYLMWSREAGLQESILCIRGERMFSYYQLRVFCTAIEKGSFVSAARDLFTSQPAISHQIKTMEQHFGVPLLIRTSRGIGLTEVGTWVYKLAKNVLREIETVEEQVKLYNTSSSTYTIGSGVTSGTYILPRIIAQYQLSNPDIVINLKIDKADNLFEGIRNNKIDLLFKLITKCPEDFTVSPVFDDKLVLVGSNEQLDDELSDNVVERLSLIKIIYKPKPLSQLLEHLQAKMKEVYIELNVSTEVNHPEAAKKAVESGLGVALMFQCSVLKELKAGQLRRLPIDLGLDATFGFMWNRGKRLAQPLVRFMEIAREQIS